MFCYKCGKEIDDEAIVCPHCGCATKNYNPRVKNVAPAQPREEGVSSKSRLVALLLCIFLGIFGAHRFYIGKTGTAVLWMFTAGCAYVGWIVDIIFIACGKMTDKDGNVLLYWE